MKSLQRVEVLSACKEIDVKVPLRCHALRVYWQASGGAAHGFALSLGCFVWLNQFLTGQQVLRNVGTIGLTCVAGGGTVVESWRSQRRHHGDH